MLFWCFAMSALASGPWSGVDPTGLVGLAPPIYLAPEAGWAAGIPEEDAARVRVFVGRSEAQAREWIGEQREEQPNHPPEYPLGDEAYGNGHSLLLLREGNVVVAVEREADAADLARQVADALAPETPWPEAPEVSVAGQMARVSGTWAQVTWRVSPVLDPQTMLPKPSPVVPAGPGEVHLASEPRWVEARVWDRFGRWADARWERPATP